MVQSKKVHKIYCLIIMCLSVLSGVRGYCQDKQSVSPQELSKIQEDVKAKTQEVDLRLRDLDKRASEIEAEITSPNRKRSLEQIREELESIAKEREKQHKLFNEAMERHDNAVLASVKGRSAVIAGTPNACGVAEQLYQQFMSTLESKQTLSFPPQLYYESDSSDACLKKLIAGKTMAVVLDHPLTDIENDSLEAAFPDPERQPQEFMFGRVAVAIIVNRGSHFEGLTTEQVEHIYRAKIEKWSAFNGADQAIGRLGTKYPLLSWWMFTNMILHGKTVRFPDEFKYDPNNLPQAVELDAFYKKQRSRFPGGGPFPCYETDAKLIEQVSKKSNAIGYCILFPSSDKMKNVRIVPIARKEGEAHVPPLRDNVLSDDYPLQNVMWFLVHPDATESIKAFVKFASGPKATKNVKQCGLWPEYELEQVRRQQRLAEFKAGKGTPIALCNLTGNERLLADLAIEFVMVKAAVQLKVQKDITRVMATENLIKGSSELLVDDRNGQLVVASGHKSYISPSPRSIELGKTAVGIVVHPQNVLNALPFSELQGIFWGDVRQWPGADKATGIVHVYGIQHDNPIVPLFRDMLANGKDGKALIHSAEADTVKVVMAVAKDPLAIGFVDLSKLSPDEKSVKLLNVYLPENQPTKDAKEQAKPKATAPRHLCLAAYHLPENYPLARTLTLYVSPNASETAKDFAVFLTPEHCAETLAKHNMIPSSHTERPVRKKNVAEAVAKGGNETKPAQTVKAPEVKSPVKDANTNTKPVPAATSTTTPPVEVPQKEPAPDPVKQVPPTNPVPSAPEKSQPNSPPTPKATSPLSSDTTPMPYKISPENGGLSNGGRMILVFLGVGWLWSVNRRRKSQ